MSREEQRGVVEGALAALLVDVAEDLEAARRALVADQRRRCTRGRRSPAPAGTRPWMPGSAREPGAAFARGVALSCGSGFLWIGRPWASGRRPGRARAGRSGIRGPRARPARRARGPAAGSPPGAAKAWKQAAHLRSSCPRVASPVSPHAFARTKRVAGNWRAGSGHGSAISGRRVGQWSNPPTQIDCRATIACWTVGLGALRVRETRALGTRSCRVRIPPRRPVVPKSW